MAKAKIPEGLEVIDIGHVPTEDERLATASGGVVTQFMAGARAFFTRAKEIESAAVETLVRAKALKAKPPTTLEEDEAVQTFIKGTSADKRTALDHWDTLTSTLSGWHKRSTAARARAVTALEEANAIGNALHNGYVEAERRRVAEENERIRREAEDKARRKREEETARMEAEALRAEQDAPTLSKREEAFVAMVVGGMDPKRAEAAAGFKKGTRPELLPKIQRAIAAKQAAQAIREQAEAVKQQPLEVAPVEEVKANISHSAGTFDRPTWSGELLDEKAFIDAVISGKYGLDRYALLAVKQPALNDLAQSMHELLDRIPGVRHKKTTKAIGR